jgi:hypothetical protein
MLKITDQLYELFLASWNFRVQVFWELTPCVPDLCFPDFSERKWVNSNSVTQSCIAGALSASLGFHKLTFPQFFKKFLSFYVTRIAMFTAARFLYLSRGR